MGTQGLRPGSGTSGLRDGPAGLMFCSTADAIAVSTEEISVSQVTRTSPLRVFCTRAADG